MVDRIGWSKHSTCGRWMWSVMTNVKNKKFVEQMYFNRLTLFCFHRAGKLFAFFPQFSSPVLPSVDDLEATANQKPHSSISVQGCVFIKKIALLHSKMLLIHIHIQSDFIFKYPLRTHMHCLGNIRSLGFSSICFSHNYHFVRRRRRECNHTWQFRKIVSISDIRSASGYRSQLEEKFLYAMYLAGWACLI